jgi:hypothetical protein
MSVILEHTATPIILEDTATSEKRSAEMADKGKWLEQKARLANQGLVHALFTTLDDMSFRTTGALKFEPLLIARHSQRLGELLDRCLNIRKDIRELEVLEVKAATDYDLFNATSKIDEQMDVLRLQAESKSKDQEGFHKAAAAFSNMVTLEKGLSEIAQGRDAALADDLKTSDKLKSLIETRWQSLREYQDAYHARHKKSGNAHNYGERAELLLQVLTVLLDEALARAAALAMGIYRIYGVKIDDPPASVTLQTVDQLAVWGLKTIRSLSHAAEEETTSEIVIPLVQPWLPTGRPLLKAEDFNTTVSKAKNGEPISLDFDLPNNALLPPKARLKGIGVSFGNEFELVVGSGIDRNQTADAFARLSVKITTPLQTGEDGKTYHRPEVLIGNVGLHSTSGMSLIEGNAIDFGTWNFVIHPFLVWKDGTQKIISDPEYSPPMKDLKVTLRFYVPGPYTR